jgi:ABC-2 type transport system ATP-binding protein
LRKGKLIDEIIEKTGLGLEQRKKIGPLSKGYKQRTGIAQALIHNPEVLILDEPTSGLDPNQLTEIRNLIKEIGKEKTVILSSHIMQEVEAVCSKVIIVNKGNIVANGNVREISQNLGKSQIINVEFDKAPPKQELIEIKGVQQVDITGSLVRITADKKLDIRAELFKYAVSKQYTILTLRSEEGSLEDIFRELTNKKNG